MGRWHYEGPHGETDSWVIEPFTVSAQGAAVQRFRAMAHGRGVPAGDYTRLLRKGGGLVMSDTPDEKRDHRAVFGRQGHILVAGLGLGLVADTILSAEHNPAEHVTIIEISSDLIDFVGPFYLSRYPGRIEIVHADVRTWKPGNGAKWDAAWFDIWDDICLDNFEEMKTLTRRFARRAGWKGCWSRGQIEAEIIRGNRSSRGYW